MAAPDSLDRRMVDRMILFSDAIFAIALTLLVLELRPPSGIVDDAALMDAAMALAPQFLALLISFALAGMWWATHMAVMRELIAFDWPTAICNLAFLLFIVLLPFAAAVFGRNIESNAGLGIYWIINAGAAYAMAVMFWFMSRDGGRLIGGIGWGERLLRLYQSGIPALVFTLGAVWAFAGQEWLARFAWVLLIPLLILAGFWEAAIKRRKARA